MSVVFTDSYSLLPPAGYGVPNVGSKFEKPGMDTGFRKGGGGVRLTVK